MGKHRINLWNECKRTDTTFLLNEVYSFTRNFHPTMFFFVATGLMGLCVQTLKEQEWTEFSWRNNIDDAKFSVETRLEHGVPIE